jgi:uncharacterized protein (TIGR03083 family)
VEAATDPLEVLRGECRQVSDSVLTVPDEDFARPTRCTAWNVKELLGHLYGDVDRINVALSVPGPAEPNTDSVSYWRSYDPIADAPDIADRAKELAAAHPTGKSLAEAWDEMWPRALETAEQSDRSRVVVTWGPALTLDEFLKTRVLEVTIHGADLADGLGRPPWATDEGLRITNEILRTLVGADLPPQLDWDDLTLMEKGSGRTPITSEERRVLGALADRFPLMG